MRRLLCALLALCLAAGLCACRSRDERDALRAQLDYANGYAGPERTDWAMDDGTTVERTVLLAQEDGLTVTALGIYEDDYDVSLVLQVRNEGRRDVSLSCDRLAVNGWEVDAYVYGSTVYAGGMADLQLSFPRAGLYRTGADAVWSLDYELRFYDDAYDTVAGIEGSLATSHPAQALAMPGEVCYESESVALSLAGVVVEESYVEVWLAAENRSRLDLTLESEYAAVDGDEETMVDFWLWETLSAGSRRLFCITLWRDDLAGITGSEDLPETLTVPLVITEDYSGVEKAELTISLAEE